MLFYRVAFLLNNLCIPTTVINALAKADNDPGKIGIKENDCGFDLGVNAMTMEL